MGNLDTELAIRDTASHNHVQGLSDAAEIELASKEREFISDVKLACKKKPYPLFNWLEAMAETPELLAMICALADDRNLDDTDKLEGIRGHRDRKAEQFADMLWARIDSGQPYVENVLDELDLNEYLD